MSGTVLAQLIPLAVSPILTRFYSPTEFGTLAVFVAIIAILASVATGRYELAISLPNEETLATTLVVVCIVLSLIASIFLFLIIVIFHDKIIANVFIENSIIDWIYLTPIAVMAVGTYKALNYWHLRQKLYSRISKNRITQSFINAIVSLGAANTAFSAVGLVLGELASRIFVTILHALYFKKNLIIWKFNTILLTKTMKKYKNCPLYLVPAELLNMSSKQFPIILFAYFFNSSFVGYLMLAQRVIQAPIGVVSSAMSEVLLQRTADEFREKGNCWNTYKRMFFMLVFLPILPLAIIYYSAPHFPEIVFGSAWRDMGVFIRILVPFYYIYFISGTLNIVFISSGRQKVNLLMQMLYAALTISSVLIGYWLWKDEIKVLILYVTANTLYFIIALFFSYRISKGSHD